MEALKTLVKIHKNVFSGVPFKIARLLFIGHCQTNNSTKGTFLEMLKKKSIMKKIQILKKPLQTFFLKKLNLFLAHYSSAV